MVMGLAPSPLVRLMRVGKGIDTKTGRMHSEREEEELLLVGLKSSEEDEAGRRMEAVTESDTGDRMQLISEIGGLLLELVDGIGTES